MSKSMGRVIAAAEAAGIGIAVTVLPDSTRTAEEAAKVCGCTVAQIVKSLIFQGTESGTLKLFLVSGANRLDLERAAEAAGEPIERADPRRVREKTGFAIGGVAPIGHLAPLPCWIDADLMGFETVWAAAGTPHAVFDIAPGDLRHATGGTVVALGG
ncbi:MAG: YbaK/EbsC family protein [Alphaproteobacteria bacterium]|nr:YbaK/EbsC family protein [Alphaproteobacteria bacterium]